MASKVSVTSKAHFVPLSLTTYNLNTISKLSYPPNLIICSTSNPLLCKFEANVLLNV